MSKFKERVIKTVKLIPKGTVVNYGQVALMVGLPRAARQVGWILHEYGDKVPWWRVINSAGRISTTCIEHNANRQKKLLEGEGIVVTDKLKVDIEKYRFRPDPDFLEKLELEDEYISMLVEKYLI
jgi:methylated-DNA-protein-cysteine methyltransferase related protein